MNIKCGTIMGGATNLKMGGVNRLNTLIARWGVNTKKTLKFEKGEGYMTPPPALGTICATRWRKTEEVGQRRYFKCS